MLKEEPLRWFMGLGANVSIDWDTMKNLFLDKYKDYYRGSMGGDDIFKIQ
jgi:hypothetical protein